MIPRMGVEVPLIMSTLEPDATCAEERRRVWRFSLNAWLSLQTSSFEDFIDYVLFYEMQLHGKRGSERPKESLDGELRCTDFSRYADRFF